MTDHKDLIDRSAKVASDLDDHNSSLDRRARTVIRELKGALQISQAEVEQWRVDYNEMKMERDAALARLAELTPFVVNCSRMEGGMVNGNRLSISANLALGFGEVIGKQQTSSPQQPTSPDHWRLQFLTDVVTAAGLVTHGKQDKGLATRLANDAMRWRCELFEAVGASPAQSERSALEQFDLDRSPDYIQGRQDGRKYGYEVGKRHTLEHVEAGWIKQPIPKGYVKASDAIDVRTIHAQLHDIWSELNAVDTVLGDQNRLMVKVEKLRDACGSAANCMIPIGEQPSETQQPDMFWNHDDAEKLYSSVGEFLNDEICNGGPLEVGDTRTIQCAIRLPNYDIRITAIDDEECHAEYEVIDAKVAA